MLKFDKYHGLGNDFVVCRGGAGDLDSDQIVRICDRHRGVGADGVLLVEETGEKVPAQVQMVVYNRDGSRPEMCGNGLRCVAAYAARRWELGDRFAVRTDAGDRECRVEPGGNHRRKVTVQMGPARVEDDRSSVCVGDHSFEYVAVDLGNPHAVIFESPGERVVEKVGRELNDDHPRFEQGVNVEFAVQQQEAGRFRATVFERGVGLTRACGTGACAVAAAAWHRGLAEPDRAVEVRLPGGALTIRCRDGQLWMAGPARRVFAGSWLGDG